LIYLRENDEAYAREVQTLVPQFEEVIFRLKTFIEGVATAENEGKAGRLFRLMIIKRSMKPSNTMETELKDLLLMKNEISQKLQREPQAAPVTDVTSEEEGLKRDEKEMQVKIESEMRQYRSLRSVRK